MTKIGRREHWRALQPHLPPRSRSVLAVIGALSFVGGLAESGVLILVTMTADSLIRELHNVSVLGLELGRGVAIGLAMVLVLVRVAAGTGAAYGAARLSGAVVRRTQTSLAEAYLASSHEVRSRQALGDLATVTTSHGRFTGDLANGFTQVASAVCGLIAFGGASLMVNPGATAVIAAVGLVLMMALRPLRRRSQHAADDFSDRSRSLGARLTEVETTHREIEAFHVAERVGSELSRAIGSGAASYQRVRFMGALVPQAFQAAILAAAVVSLLVVADRAGPVALASIGTVILLLIRSMTSAQLLVAGTQRLVEHGAYTRALNDLLARLRDPVLPGGHERPASLLPIRVDKVDYAYQTGSPVLTGITAEIHPGEIVGLCGPSGAGKSTLVELLLHLRAPTAGSITVGGAAIGAVDEALLRRKMAFVPQQANLIAGTIADNVRFYRDADPGTVRRALEQAHLASEIATLPEGEETRLGPETRSLSGGQRQRLTIARALLGAPDVLILDEPTSALDAVSEQAIRATLADMPPSVAVLIVAHRFSTLRSCSRILVLEGGRIVADGTPHEAASASPFFRRMWSGDDNPESALRGGELERGSAR